MRPAMRPSDDDIDVLQASLLRTIASPARLRIIHLLGTGSLEVNEIARALALPQTATSQHLGALRSVGLVEPTREGRTVRYRLADPEISAACGGMRAVLVRRLSRLGDLAAAASATLPTFASTAQGDPSWADRASR